MTLRIMTLNIMAHVTEHNDTQYNATQYYDTQHNDIQYYDTQHNDTQLNNAISTHSLMTLSIVTSRVKIGLIGCLVFIFFILSLEKDLKIIGLQSHQAVCKLKMPTPKLKPPLLISILISFRFESSHSFSV
jgi:hypothetical protein